ncbi:MAG: glycosyltransferase family 2 protein [Bacteroidales bacterium]
MSLLISIIIPVYNSKLYLEKCLDSIIEQTYSNIEILLVDDGSNDGSSKICDLYAANNNRIKVFHKQNGGVSSARNTGLKNALGDWALFLDSDDYVAATWVQGYVCKLNEINDYKSIVFQGYNKTINGKLEIITIDELYFKKNNKGECLKYLHIDNDVLGYVWSKIFNLKLIREYNILFNESVSLSEDMLFTLDYLQYCNLIFTMSVCNYFYRLDNIESLSKKKNDFLIAKNIINMIYSRVFKILDNNKYKILFELRKLDSRFCALLNLFVNRNAKYDKKFIINEIADYKRFNHIKLLRYSNKSYWILNKVAIVFSPKIIYAIFSIYFFIKHKIKWTNNLIHR